MALWRKLRAWLGHYGAGALIALMGAADGRAVGLVAARELSLILRSRAWVRFVGMWLGVCAAIVFVPLIYRSYTGQWQHPSSSLWFVLCGYTLQGALAAMMVQWTVGRLRRDLYTNRLDELMLTRCSPADIAMAEALASAVASVWLVAASFPVCLFISGMGGLGIDAALRLAASLAPAAALGVWFGMGWGLAFALRRSAAIVPLTIWWIKGPFMPIWVCWALLGAFPVIWALLAFIPGSHLWLGQIVLAAQWVVLQIVNHWNPFLTVGAASGLWKTSWLTDWLMFIVITAFMMRKSMDAVQIALAQLPEHDSHHEAEAEGAWVHHDVHYFTVYGDADGKRREPKYLDNRNAVTAFDVALGHRVYLHPFFWCLGILLYLFLVGWSMLVPAYGKMTAAAAVLVPATGALLLMSGGVAISFGWERDQHRWPALAVLPLTDLRLALGKILGVVRPTLWTGLLASMTAVLMGWRGALEQEVALWMALHVLVFPVTLAFVCATLALTTPTVGEALYRWGVLGAIPTLATLLPAPLGGLGGISLPFTPPLLVLLLVIFGATPELIRGAWISLGLELFGIAASLLILGYCLRRWTVGEKD